MGSDSNGASKWSGMKIANKVKQIQYPDHLQGEPKFCPLVPAWYKLIKDQAKPSREANKREWQKDCNLDNNSKFKCRMADHRRKTIFMQTIWIWDVQK